MQASRLECLSFDPFSSFQYDFILPEVDVSGCDVVEALVVALMVVLIDEGRDFRLKIAGLEVVFHQDAVLEGLMPAIARQANAKLSAERGRVMHFLRSRSSSVYSATTSLRSFAPGAVP